MSPNKRLVNLNLQKFQFSLNSNQIWNNDKCLCECKNPTEHRVCEKKKKNWNRATCSCENCKYIASITDNSVITCDHIINDKISSKTRTFTTLPLHH